MRRSIKFLVIFFAVSMMLVAGAQSAFATVSAETRVYFKVLNPDDFGIPIRWLFEEYPDGPVYDEGSDLFWYYNGDYDDHYITVPINHVLARNRSLWSSAVANKIWEMDTKTYARLASPKEAGHAQAGAYGNILNYSGDFIAEKTGWMTIRLEYELHSSLSAGSRFLENATADGSIIFSLSNMVRGTDDNLDVSFDIDLGAALEEEYLQRGTVTLTLYFREGEMGNMNWLFDNLSDVKAKSLVRFP